MREHVRSVYSCINTPSSSRCPRGMVSAHVHPQLENFNDCFVETWLADDAKIPVGIWNVHGEDQKRTNNIVEGWNSKFGKLVRKHQTNIFEFIDAIRKEQAATELKTSHNTTQPYNQRERRRNTSSLTSA